MGDRPREPLELMLSESIQRFHSDRRSGVSSFAGFSSIFSRIIQTTPDPPLEVLWFYSAVSFRSENMEVVRRVSLVKELLGFLISCSGCGSGLKKVASLAPVVYELHRLVGDVMFWFSEARSDVRCLMEGVVSYVSMCCFENDELGFSGMPRFSPLLMDVVSVWLADKAEVDRSHVEDLRVFFPMISDEIRERINSEREFGFLAGSVMCEVFLLSLSLQCCSDMPRDDLRKNLHQQADQVIAGFRNLNFFDTLLRMLLEPTLPVTHLVGYAGESILREVLYDVAITVQYPFLLPANRDLLLGQTVEVALRWLLIVEKASQLLRANGNDTKALPLLNAFSESRIPCQLIEWVVRKTGMSRPVVSTPTALFRWLLAFEGHGYQIFNDQVLRAQVQGLAINSPYHGWPSTDAETKDFKTAECTKRCIDHEMPNSTNAINTSSLTATCVNGQKKRKEDMQDNPCLQAKFIKVHCHENYVKEKYLAQW